jgi:hypothetical protein
LRGTILCRVLSLSHIHCCCKFCVSLPFHYSLTTKNSGEREYQSRRGLSELGDIGRGLNVYSVAEAGGMDVRDGARGPPLLQQGAQDSEGN